MPLIWDYLNYIVVVLLSWIINHFLNWSESRTKTNTGIWRSVEILFVTAQHTCIGYNESSSRYNFFQNIFLFRGIYIQLWNVLIQGNEQKKMISWSARFTVLSTNICCKNRSLCEVMLLNKKWKIFNLFIVFLTGSMGRLPNMGMLWLSARDTTPLPGKTSDVS